MKDSTPDVVDELTTLARELERVATSTDGYDTVWRGIHEILLLRERLEIAERQLHALVHLAWPPVRKEDGSTWAEGEWRAGYRKGFSASLAEAQEVLLRGAAAVRAEDVS